MCSIDQPPPPDPYGDDDLPPPLRNLPQMLALCALALGLFLALAPDVALQLCGHQLPEAAAWLVTATGVRHTSKDEERPCD